VTPNPIPFNRVTPFGRELEYMREAVERGHISGHGPFSAACETILAEIVGSRRALLTTSCTHALELCALLIEAGPADEVIMPSFTFVSTANAFVLRGARPVFVDIRDDTLNLDERLLEHAVTPRTKAVVAVHYAGVGCEMTTIADCARRHGLQLLEDNAHGLFGTYAGRPLGSFGSASALSFHETKNVSCGEGGALLLNDAALVERAEVLREKGTNRSQFLRGEVDKYTWLDLGSSYIPSELLAGFLLGQLEARDAIQRRRHEVFARYDEGLQDWAREYDVRLPSIPDACAHPAHLYYIRLGTGWSRDRFIGALRQRGILSASHYVPLHASPMGSRFGYAPEDLPLTLSASAQLVRLPLFAGLDRADQERVIDVVCSTRPARPVAAQHG
jgi:dTDP-4-amino-4,6-dideoxygalactose transaminase